MYKITIKKIKQEDFTEREYEKISDTGNEKDNGVVYGYVEYPSTREIEINILSQEIEELDIKEVLKAINKI